MSVKIVVLSDGTWETLGEAQVMEITKAAYDYIASGMEPKDIDESNVLSTKEVK